MFTRLVSVAVGDRTKVALLSCYLLLAVGGVVVVGRSVGRALLLSVLPAEAVPLRLAIAAVSVVLATVAYSALGARLPLGRLTAVSQAVMGGGVLALWLLLKTPLGGTLPVLALAFGWLEVVAALTTMQFWVLAGQLFDPRSARRNFGLISAGGPVANLGAGALLARLAHEVATADLLLVTGAAVCLCAGTAAALARAYPEALGTLPDAHRRAGTPPGRPAESTSPLRTLGAAARSPLLGALTGIVLLGTTVTNVVDYQLDLALQARYGGDHEGMTSFLGTYNVWVGAVSLVIQVGLISFVLKHFGLRAALGALPAGFAVGAMAVIASGGALLAVAGARASDLLFRFTLNDAGLNLLYLPVPAAARRRAKEALDGVAKPVAAVGLALLLAVARAAGWTDLVVWSVPVLVLVVAWFWLVARASAAYHVALVESLRRRRLSFDDVTVDAADPATRAALLDALLGPDEPLALAALQTIAGAPGDQWAAAVAQLVDSPSSELRIAAAQYLARTGQRAFQADLGRLLAAPEPAVRAAAIAALAGLGGDVARQFLDDAAFEVRRAAAVAIAKRDDGTDAAALVRRWAVSSDPSERRAAAEAIAEIGRSGWTSELTRLLDDARPDVQRAALRAVAATGERGLASAAVERLAAAATVSAASEALLALDQDPADADRPSVVRRLLADRLNDRHGDDAVRRAVPALLGRIGGEAATSALLAHVGDPDPAVRAAVYTALAARPIDESRRATLAERVLPELREAYALRAVWADLGPDGRGELLGEAVEQRLERTVDRVFTLLEALFPGLGLSEARRAIRGSDARSRANALEVVDALARGWRADLMPLLEADPERVAELAQSRLGLARRGPAERLVELASGDDRWLRVCALERIGRLRLSDLGHLLERAAIEDDGLVRETAAIAARSLRRREGVAIADDPAPR